MSPVYSARRAERFDALIEGSASTPSDVRTAQLVALVALMRSAGAADVRPEPRLEFVADLRERLMTAAATELAPAVLAPEVEDRRTVHTPARGNRRVTATLAGFALVGASATMAVASQASLPGDMLYPVKRALENVGTQIAMNDVERGSRLLAGADTRLDELEDLVAEGDPESEVVVETLDTFTAQAVEGSGLLLEDARTTGSRDSAQQVLDFTGASTEQLADLESTLPADARGALLRAAEAIFSIDATASQVCATCDGGITEVPLELQSAGAAVGDQTGMPLPGAPSPSTDTVDDLGAAWTPDILQPSSLTNLFPTLTSPAPGGASGSPAGTSANGDTTPSGGSGPGLPGGSTPTSTAVQDGAEQTAQDTSQQVTGGLEGTTGQVTGGVQDVTEQVDDTVGGTTDTVDQVVGDATDGVDQVLPGSGGAVDQTTDVVDETVEQTTDTVDDVVEGTADAVNDTVCTVTAALGGCPD